jgi:hypothetical protein
VEIKQFEMGKKNELADPVRLKPLDSADEQILYDWITKRNDGTLHIRRFD